MNDGTAKYLDTVKYLEKLFDFCNDRLFNGELIKPVITIQRDERNKTNGWWTTKKVWKWTEKVRANCADCDDRGNCNYYGDCVQFKDREEYELNMTAQQLNRPIKEIAATLIHEMCHEYASINNMQDTSRSGNYHNKLFKKIAEMHGLKVECVQTIGWSHTELTTDTALMITEFTNDNTDTLIYRLPVMHGQSVKNSSTRKYICPVCGQSVRATKAVNIMCADCNEFMQLDD